LERYENLPTLTVLLVIARQPQYFAPENYLTISKCSFHISELYRALSTTVKALSCSLSMARYMYRDYCSLSCTLVFAHKLLTAILSLTNYYQEVFRPRLKFPGLPTLIFSRWALAHPAPPVPAPVKYARQYIVRNCGIKRQIQFYR